MQLVQSPVTLSLDDFLERPETKPATEYVNGIATQKTMPKGKHSRLTGVYAVPSMRLPRLGKLAPLLQSCAVPLMGAPLFLMWRCFDGGEFHSMKMARSPTIF